VNILNSTNSATASVGEVSGSDVYFAGGGKGNATGSPGIGGGGNANASGAPNTGGGGGGDNFASHTGGSGVVILRYTSSSTITVGAGITQASGSPFTEGTDKVSVFTGGTGNIQFN
jgi:hypothetical protein